MAPAHVPKFGDWDSDNIPYTSFFENARKEKVPGTKNFNPNDPEQNPDAFMSGIFPTEYELRNNYSSITSKGDDEFRQEYKEVQINNKSYKNHKDANSEYRTDNSNSDCSLPRPPNRRRPNSRHSDEDGVLISSSQKSVSRSGISPPTDIDVPSSIPRFGVWGEMDSKSRDGFTVIFNKVKQEKQVAAIKLPKVPTEPIIHPSTNHAKTPLKSKITCCFCPSVNE